MNDVRTHVCICVFVNFIISSVLSEFQYFGISSGCVWSKQGIFWSVDLAAIHLDPIIGKLHWFEFIKLAKSLSLVDSDNLKIS